jgi:hypothetical protein
MRLERRSGDLAVRQKRNTRNRMASYFFGLERKMRPPPADFRF